MSVVTGVLKFFNMERGFGILDSIEGTILLHKTKAGDFSNALVEGAELTVRFVTKYEDDKFKRTAVEVLGVTAPKWVRCFAKVKWYNPDMGYGFVTVVGSDLDGKEVYLSATVCDKAGVLPSENMPMWAVVTEKRSGRFAVTSFVSNEQVAVEFANFIAKPAADPVVVETAAAPKAKQVRAKKAKSVDIADMVAKSDGGTALAGAMKKAAGNGAVIHH